MTAVCPICGAGQSLALACHACVTRLERDLTAVPAVMADLYVAVSKQARIGQQSGGGLARERTPVNWGASDVAANLTNVLTTWARDVRADLPATGSTSPAVDAARILLANVDLIRRHRAVEELVDEITDAVAQARRVVDRPQDRVFVGPCRALLDHDGTTYQCSTDLYALPGAPAVTCRVCSSVTDVTDQRMWLLEEARDRLFTVREAAQMIGDLDGIRVTESSIRGLLHRERLAYRPGTRLLRLGDLLEVLADKHSARTP